MTSERSPASDDLARALDRAVYASLRPVLVCLTVLFCLFAIAHPLVLPAGAAMPMMVLAGSSSVIFLVLYGLLHAGRLPGERPQIYAVMVAALVLANSLVHLHLVGEPRDTTNLLLFMVGAGFLLLSTRWLLACLAVTLAGWVLVATAHPPFDPWGRFLFALVSASVLSLLVHIVRLRTVIGFEQLRADLEGLVTERTRTLASERNLLRTLVDNLPDGVFVKDTAGRYRLANAAHRRQLGLGSSEELAHRTVIDMAPGDWARREAEEDRGVIETGTPVLDREQEIQLGIDRVRLVTSKVPVSEPGGGVVGAGRRDPGRDHDPRSRGGAAPHRSAAAGDAEAGESRRAGRRHRARLQQPADRRPGQHQPGAPPARQPGRDLVPPRRHRDLGDARGRPLPADAGLRRQGTLPRAAPRPRGADHRHAAAAEALGGQGRVAARGHRPGPAGDVRRSDADAAGGAEPRDQRVGRDRGHRHHRDPPVRRRVGREHARRAGPADRARTAGRATWSSRSATPAAA